MVVSAAASGADGNLPDEVKKLVDRRQDCHHWAGEEPYDKARAKQIDRAMRSLKCDDVDRDVDRMRKEYPGDAAVRAALPDTIDTPE